MEAEEILIHFRFFLYPIINILKDGKHEINYPTRF